MEALIEKPTIRDQEIARKSIPSFQKATKLLKSRHGVMTTINITNQNVEVPERALLLFKEILSNMAKGNSITIIPSNSELSSQQAADILNVSRPHLVKLLEKGEIPYSKVGKHRRIQIEDIEKYRIRLKKTRSENLAFLTNQAQELNLGY